MKLVKLPPAVKVSDLSGRASSSQTPDPLSSLKVAVRSYSILPCVDPGDKIKIIRFHLKVNTAAFPEEPAP